MKDNSEVSEKFQCQQNRDLPYDVGIASTFSFQTSLIYEAAGQLQKFAYIFFQASSFLGTLMLCLPEEIQT